MDNAQLADALAALKAEFRSRAPRKFRPAPVFERYPNLSGWVRDTILGSIVATSEGRTPETCLTLLTEGINPNHLVYYYLRLAMATAPVHCAQIEDTSHSQEAIAEAHNISPAALQALWRSAFDDESLLRQYHIDLLRKGSFDFPDHREGAPRSLSASLLILTDWGHKVRPHNFYSTAGECGFMCMEQPLVGGLAALFIPGRNLFIGTPRQPTPLPVEFLRAHMLAFPTQTSAYLQEGRRRLALLVGSSEHIGHTVLNEYSAVDRCARTGLLRNVRSVIRGWVGFLPHADFLPELADLPVVTVETTVQTYYLAVRHRLLVVRPTRTRMWISDGLIDRLRDFDDRRGADLGDGGVRGPTVWCEVRSNDRIWRGQCEGIARAVNALKAKWPTLRLVLAGWSRPGDTTTRPYDSACIERDRQLTAAIRNMLDPDIPCIDITGCSTPEKLRWARRIDVYATVYSSGMIFPHAFGKPGFIYCSHHFTNKLLSGAFENLIKFQSEAVPLFILKPEHVRVDAGQEDALDAAFDFDWGHLRDALDWLLTEESDKERRTQEMPFAHPPPSLAPLNLPEARGAGHGSCPSLT